jgi:hypothetical protein
MENSGRDRSQRLVEPKVPPRFRIQILVIFFMGAFNTIGRILAVVLKFGKIVKFFQKYVDQWHGGHSRVSRIKDNIFSIYCE